MKRKTILLIILACALSLVAGATAWGAKGGTPGKPPAPEDPPDIEAPTEPGGGGDGDEGPLPPTPIDGYYFWKLGHMDGPHTASKAFGISRDGRTAVGENVVVDFTRAWRVDIDWAINSDDPTGDVGIPPLYNELQVMEDLGVVAPSQPSAAFASSNMDLDENGEIVSCDHYDKVNLVLDWCGSKPAGTFDIGQVSYGIQWLLPVLDSVDEGDYLSIPDFGGGIADMSFNDVSADGTVVVGTGHTKTGPKGFRADTAVLDEDGVPVAVQLTIQDEVTLQTLRSSSAQAVSADGQIIVGFGSTKQANRAFVTTSEDYNAEEPVFVSTILPMLGGGKFAEAYAMTSDEEGNIYIAGRSDSPKGPVACIWFKDETDLWVIKELGSLSTKNKDSVATGIVYRPGSDVGELMVVGRSQSILYPSEAFVWTGNPVVEDDEIGYFHDLEYILIKTGAGEASGMGSSWILYEATGVALSEVTNAGDNGPSARIVGWGINPEGGVEAWVVTNYPYDELDLTHEE